MKRIGTYGDYHFFRGTKNTVTGVFYGRDEYHAINLIGEDDGETVEGFVDALRAATQDPQSRLLAALADYIGDDERHAGTPVYRELMAAFDAVTDAEEEGDDGEE